MPEEKASPKTETKKEGKFSKEEIESGKGMSILAYIGILSLIPFFAEKKNKFVIYHAKQGVNLFICELIIGVGLGIISSVLAGFIGATLNFLLAFILIPILSILSWGSGIYFLIVSIIGIVQACNGEAKELPLVSKIKIVK